MTASPNTPGDSRAQAGAPLGAQSYPSTPLAEDSVAPSPPEKKAGSVILIAAVMVVVAVFAYLFLMPTFVEPDAPTALVQTPAADLGTPDSVAPVVDEPASPMATPEGTTNDSVVIID